MSKRRSYALGKRLTDTYEGTLDHVLDLVAGGVALEFGVGSGKSLRRIATHMPVIGFDSWQGLPETWEAGRFDKGTFKCDPPTVPNTRLVEGLYADTLPTFDFEDYDIRLVHIDCDLYTSTMTVLEHVTPHLHAGCFIVFDEYHGFDRCVQHEQQAFRDFTKTSPLRWTVLGHGPEQWAIQVA